MSAETIIPEGLSIRTNQEGEYAEFYGRDGECIIDDQNGMAVAYVSDRNLKDKSLRNATAEEIVRAYNVHDDLVEALKIVFHSKAREVMSVREFDQVKEALAKAGVKS